MRRIPSLAIFVLTAMLCGGCWPRRFVAGPGVAGVVVDAQSQKPLSGVEAAISLSKYPPDSPSEAWSLRRNPTVISDTNGQFVVPIDKRWGLYIWPVDSFPEFGLLVLKQRGYQTSSIPVWSHSMTNVGLVFLKPLPKNGVTPTPTPSSP